MIGVAKFLILAIVGIGIGFFAMASLNQRSDDMAEFQFDPLRSSFVLDYEIPDPTRPIAEADRGSMGPTGALMPFKPDRLVPSDVVGRTVDDVLISAGTYGMGGPGFMGFRLGDDWLVIAIWGAGDWITVEARLITDAFHSEYGRQRPWFNDLGDDLSPALVGQIITAIDVQPRSLSITFDNGMVARIDESPDGRPLFQGPKKPRIFVPGDDLRDVVFLAPTAELWI